MADSLAQQVIEDKNNDGIPDHLQAIAEVPGFAPKWENRRLVIHVALGLLGFVFLITALCILAAVIASGVMGLENRMSNELSDLTQSLLWVSSLTAISVIGSYCFGASFEANNMRTSLTEMAGKLVRPRVGT